jgi:hypothetical protein
MVRLAIPLLLCFSASVSAQIYRWVDADGQTHYSDHPNPGSDRLDIKSGVASSNSRPATREGSTVPSLGPYRSFEIVSPEPNQTLRLESASLPVSLLLDPPLMAGHRLELLVDGEPIKFEEPIGTQLSLNGLSLGTHSTEAHILDGTGIVARSAPVSFHLRRPLPPGVIQ